MLYLYERGEESDLLLVKWWAQMKEDKDLELTFSSPPSLSRLFECFKPPVQLVFQYDQKGIYFSAWFEPFFDGVAFSTWIRRDYRQSKASLALFLEAAEMGFIDYPVLLGITKQKRIVPLHLRLGYHLLGEVPRLFGGETAFILVWDRLDFLKDKEKGKWQRLWPHSEGEQAPQPPQEQLQD